MRPVAEVFAFYRDFQNLPRFLGDVMAIEETGTAKVTDVRVNDLEGALGSLLPCRRALGETIVREVLIEPGGWIAEAALGLIGKSPAPRSRSQLH